MAVGLAPAMLRQFFDNNGDPLAGGKLYTYQTGTSTPQATYTDATGVTPNANPIILDASGRARVWLDHELSYKFVLYDSEDNLIGSEDGVVGVLAEDSVSTNSVQDGAITEPKIGAGAVTEDKHGDHSVSLLKIKSDAVMDSLNVALAASVASNALTIALKGVNGSDPAAGNPVYLAFRSSTAATGTPVVRSVTAALSVVVSSGSTLGHASNADQFVHVYAIDNAGTVELAVSGQKFSVDGALVSTTAEGAAGAADSGLVLYSTTARTGVAAKYLGRIKSNQAAAGTWATAPSEIALIKDQLRTPRSEIFLYGQNGHGSTNNKIRKWTNLGKNVGSDMTLTQSATNGDSVLINTDGVYAITYIDGFSSVDQRFGVTLNSAQLTTSIASVTITDILCINLNTVANRNAQTGTIVTLRAGDIVRGHTTGGSDGSAPSECSFRIVKVTD